MLINVGDPPEWTYLRNLNKKALLIMDAMTRMKLAFNELVPMVVLW
jgi:hypothetical protein